MIRFIKNILDIKNLLGMQRSVPPIPEPAYPANETILRASGDRIRFTPVMTGDIYVHYIAGGSPQTYIDSTSGVLVQLQIDPGSDVVITGNIQQIQTGNATFLATSDSITSIGVDPELQTIDLRNYLGGSIGHTVMNVSKLYASAETIPQLFASRNIINNSTVQGIVWIDMTQTYANALKTSAENYGWTVYDL